MRSRKKLIKVLALILAFNMIISTMVPTVTLALTSGPSQPEFSSFEPVATTNMVNDFTGDFTYNLPVLEVPGPHGSSYPISLSYHSGVTPEEEASWVGFGWTLNAGAINRSKRGIPDDFKNKQVTNHNKTPKNWTATVGASTQMEAFGVDAIGLSASVRYNNYRGFGYNASIGAPFAKGLLDIGYSISDGEGSFSLNMRPITVLQKASETNTRQSSVINEQQGQQADRAALSRDKSEENQARNPRVGLGISYYGLYRYAETTRSLQLQPYSGTSVNFTLGLEVNPSFLPIGPSANLFGSYSSQTNDPEVSSRAYGYMYSGEANDVEESDDPSVPGRKSGLMDYHIENGSSFNKRDTVLGVPFNDADQFIVNGEGIGGGFRMYHKQLGHFGPREVSSSIDITNLGAEIQVGGNFGGGADNGKGFKKSTLYDWNRFPTGSDFSNVSDASESDEPVFFRFNNDLGGSWGDAMDDNPFQAILNSGTYTLNESNAFKYDMSTGRRSGRSSYIGFNFNKDVLSSGFNPSYKAYSKRHDLNALAGKNLPSLQDNIGELAIFNESGLRYVYGLPVYSQMEKTLSYGIEGGVVENNSEVYFSAQNVEKYFDQPKIKVGQEMDDPYATSFLLTEVTTPDYVDRSLDGPTVDDFGGYTRFNYQKVYGNSSEKSTWYKWRFPYNGLRYQRNSLSDSKDDLATVRSGEKEVYYLQSIETKSHVAIFVTEDRTGDGFAAADGNTALTDGQRSADALKKLDKIELYPISEFPREPDGTLSRNEDGTIAVPENVTPVKTVHFKYAKPGAELAKGAPNMLANRGKLTLERVYFEYNNKSNEVEGVVRISPYTFGYEYPDFADYPAKYRSGDDDLTFAKSTENPDYSVHSSDAWGNFQPDGETQHANMRNWLDQGISQYHDDPAKRFDPAAWHLKTIKLPSGGAIHVQYESDDYQYVQDQEAHVMAPLLPNGGSTDTFIIDHEKVGLRSTDADFDAKLDRMAEMIQKRYVDEGKKIYFKFLYQLIGGNIPDLNSCSSEYISGYADVESVSVVTGGGKSIHVKLKGDQLPEKVCKEFTKTQRLGMLDPSGNCSPSNGSIDDSGVEKVVRQLLNFAQGVAIPQTLCQNINEELSYLRVPTSIPKRGGGLRVKRLLTFDQGLEGNPVLYGNEYKYETLDDEGNVISSGVATNEPQSMREENILVDVLKRKKQTFRSKVIAGKDRKQQEGPIGETIYPGPSVGYSRVAIRNIHSGETNPGFSVNQYFTARDYPVKVLTTNLKDDIDQDNIFAGLFNFALKEQWATQGFSFVLNNMHGQAKSMGSYAGSYSDMTQLDNSALVSEQVFEYYEPGEKVPVKSDAFGATEMTSLGREVDITLAQKSFEEEMIDANIEYDLTIGLGAFIIPIGPFATAVPSITSTEGKVATHTASKVVRYPAILKRSTSYQDGIYHISEPLAFDKLSGRAVATRSFDEFKGTYVSQEVRASWEYESMSDKATTEGKLIQTGFVLEGDRLKVAAGQVCDLKEFTRGDLIELGDGTQALFHVVEIDYITESLVVQASQQNIAPEIQSASNLRIIRTGRTNALNVSIGAVTRHDVDDGLSLATIDETNRYSTSHDFATDLNSELGGLANTEGEFTLTNTYSNMNMAAYAQANGETIDWENATVRQIEMRYKQEPDEVQLDVMAFEISCSTCAGGWYRVAADGW